jgi:hypothetical protein
VQRKSTRVLAALASCVVVAGASVLLAAPEVGASRASLVVPGTWNQVPIPNASPETTNEYNAVSCVGPTFCVAVGDAFFDTPITDTPFAAEWNGTAWTVMATPAIAPGATQAYLDGVSCLSATWCMATGSSTVGSANSTNLAELWNGTSWSILATPSTSGYSNQPQGLSCTSVSFCTAVGYQDDLIAEYPEVLQWNGTVWSMVALPGDVTSTGDATLDAVSCVGTWCRAAGSALSDPIILDGSGSSWTPETLPATAIPDGGQFRTVSCYSTSLCVAAGSVGTGGSGFGNLVLMWNGSTWNAATVPNVNTTYGNTIITADCFGPTSCVLGGWVNTEMSGDTYVPQVLAWNGTSWALQSTPVPAGASELQISSLACVPDNRCLAVGFNSRTTWAADATIFRPGYDEVASDGGLFSFGAPFFGSMGGKPLNEPIVGMAMAPDGGGYWEVASDGGLFAFGDAAFYGSMGGKPLNKPIVAMAPTLDGRGYYEVASDGGIFAFGDAVFYGSMGGKPLNEPIVGIALNPNGLGYYEVASDGGLFAFGQAPFLGSMGGKPLNKPIVAMDVTPAGGYYEVASDGGLFSFGGTAAPFLGSMGGKPLNEPIVGMSVNPAGGYYEVATDGGLFSFGTPFLGSMGGKPLNKAIVGIGE